MTVFGSTCTRHLINRTLIRNAILYHFQITFSCGRTNRPFIPLTLFLLSRPLEQLSLFVRATPSEKKCLSFSSHQLGHNDLCSLFSHATSKVDIDDISFTSNFHFKPHLRGDLLINFLVSVFTPYKNLRSVLFNLGRMCWKQISSLFTITSHNKESLRPTFLFRALVFTPPPPPDTMRDCDC